MKYILLGLLALFAGNISAHHYKGLPHYSYFENYPQVPILEFIAERPDYEMFVTVYNFQGLNLDQVNSPDDVRLYVYIYDIERNSSVLGSVDFAIASSGEPVFAANNQMPEQESIFLLQSKIESQSDLLLSASFVDVNGKKVRIQLPIQISPSFFEIYGLYLAVALFFIIVMAIKIILTSKAKQSKAPASRGLSYAR